MLASRPRQGSPPNSKGAARIEIHKRSALRLRAIYDRRLQKLLSDSPGTGAHEQSLTSFALVAVLAALLMALSLAVARHGYPYGAIGARRLDGIADPGTFIPLAAVYFSARS